MRDALFAGLHAALKKRNDILIISADLGAPALDAIRRDYPSRFINTGIAEQNAITVAVGAALEGMKVFVYGIASFITLRSFEQMRINLSLLSQVRNVDVNIAGLGAGLSYDVSGPSHHCLEDLSLVRLLPNITLFSPCDPETVSRFVEYALRNPGPKYLRLDGKPQPLVYGRSLKPSFEDGFAKVRSGAGLCFVSTGYMTHRALHVAETLNEKHGISPAVFDVFLLRPLNSSALLKQLRRYSHIVTMEEGLIEKGGLDTLVSTVLDKAGGKRPRLTRVGFPDHFLFDPGDRKYLHELNRSDDESLVRLAIKLSRMMRETA